MALLTVSVLYFLVGQLDAATLRQQQEDATTQALAQAREALIAWSVMNNSAPGRLPCPEDTSKVGTALEGQALANCNNAATRIGRLPWRTLGLPPLSDGNGDPLWYVLSDGFRATPINVNTPAALTVDGAAASAVAIVFSPGTPLPGQTRSAVSAVNPPLPEDYLDLTNADGDTTFVSAGPSGTFNDRMLPVSHRDLFSAVNKRVAAEVVQALLVFYNGDHTFPRPASFLDASCLGSAQIPVACNNAAVGNEGRIPANPDVLWTDYDPLSQLSGAINNTWFQGNGWRELVYYAVSDKCLAPSLNCSGPGNYLSVDGTADARVAVIVAGSILPGQGRAGIQRMIVTNYLEGDNATVADNSYVSGPASPIFNDIAKAIR